MKINIRHRSPETEHNPELLRDLVYHVLRRFERDTQNNPIRALQNWYFPEPIEKTELSERVLKDMYNAIRMYYHFISKYDPKNRIRSIPGIENRLRELNILLKEANEPDMNPLNKLTILIAEGLKVSRDEDFVDQLFHLFKYIIYSDLDITLHVGLIRASLSVSGLIFALEYSRRKHKNPKAWNRVAEILVEFYSELGYGGVVDAIEHVVFMENERINKIYNALKCDEDKFNNFKGILSNELKEYIYLIESRFKSKHSLLKKIQRKRIDLNDMDRINESIHDLNGIRIVLKESSMLGDVLNKLTHIVSSKFQGARVIEIELYNLDISSLDNLNIVKKRTERDYRAAHVLIMDQMTNRKIEVQIVGDPEQYRKHLYAGLVSHISYKNRQILSSITSNLLSIYDIVSRINIKLILGSTEIYLNHNDMELHERGIIGNFNGKKIIIKFDPNNLEPFMKVFGITKYLTQANYPDVDGTNYRYHIDLYADDWNETKRKIFVRL